MDAGSRRDPVCGMPVFTTEIAVSIGNDTRYFCSEFCRQRFLGWPQAYPVAPPAAALEIEKRERRIAYFSMEIAIDDRIPSYSGGLGVLAGDTIRACADLEIPIVAVTLLYRKGYFEQELDEWGNQRERPSDFSPDGCLRAVSGLSTVEIERRYVRIRAWQYDVVGQGGYVVPVLFIDSDVDGNDAWDRRLTDTLYGGDDRYRFAQEVLLGLGGLRVLRAQGYDGLRALHLNEGHASLAALGLLVESHQPGAADWDFMRLRQRCLFTTHTPVPAGHDRFGYDLVHGTLGNLVPRDILGMLAGTDEFNMTRLALNVSGFVNGVARKHKEVSESMFPGYSIRQITNGVHSATWTCDSFRALFDRYLSGWAVDPSILRQAINIPDEEVWRAHAEAKARLIELVHARTGRSLSADVFTIGFARRATLYKRSDLVFTSIDRLREIARDAGRIQFVFAGKAHPRDQQGKDMIRHIVAAARHLGDDVPVVYLANYDLKMARVLTAGVDLWLNTPEPPLEASGTSGMKAAHNGVPSLSVLDGWWLEGHVEGVTGWSLGKKPTPGHAPTGGGEAEMLYEKLAGTIVPMFYRDRAAWISVMEHSIALNASYFNTHRMVQQYAASAYRA